MRRLKGRTAASPHVFDIGGIIGGLELTDKVDPRVCVCVCLHQLAFYL